jgi:hypothetical protein
VRDVQRARLGAECVPGAGLVAHRVPRPQTVEQLACEHICDAQGILRLLWVKRLVLAPRVRTPVCRSTRWADSVAADAGGGALCRVGATRAGGDSAALSYPGAYVRGEHASGLRIQSSHSCDSEAFATPRTPPSRGKTLRCMRAAGVVPARA